MIGKIRKGSGFKGCVDYVLGKQQAVLLHADGVLAESRTGTTAIFRGGQELCSSHFRLSQGNAGNNEAVP